LAAQYKVSPQLFIRSQFRTESVNHISGNKLQVPILEFSARDYANLLRQCGLTTAQGYSFQVPIQANMRPVSIVVVCREQIPGQMPPDQIKDHEKIHAIDPLLHERKSVDSNLITEMIATIGEITGPDLNFIRVNTSEGFWMGYLSRIRTVSPELLQVLKVDTQGRSLTREILAKAIKDIIYDITLKRSNNDIVLGLMSCRNFKDVLVELKKIAPEKY